MPCRKRRCNRLTAEQLEANRELRETELNQQTILIGFGQEHVAPLDVLYRTVALRVALKMVREGDAEKFTVFTPNGRVVMFRELKPIAGAQYRLPMMPNAAAAMELAEYSGRRETQRVANVLMFPFEGDRKNPLTGPRVSELDRERARKLVGAGAFAYPKTRTLHNDLATAA